MSGMVDSVMIDYGNCDGTTTFLPLPRLKEVQ